jgi:hypothetical protein
MSHDNGSKQSMKHDDFPVLGKSPTRAYGLTSKRHRGVDLISDALPFGRLWYGEVLHAINNAIDYAKFRSRSHDAVIRVYDEAGNVIETHEHKGDFKEP